MVATNNAIFNTVGASISGVTNTLTVTNPSNTASSAAREVITVGGGTAGDPTINWNVAAATDWEMGIDNSDADKWKLAEGTALGTNDTIVAFTAGEVLKPRQPAFLVTLATHITNATGDGTTYLVKFDTVTFDVKSNYNVGGPNAGLFVAPVTGVYQFSYSVGLYNLSPSHTNGDLLFVLNGATYYQGSSGNAIAQSALGFVSWNMGLTIKLNANDTIGAVVRVFGGTKTVFIQATDVFAPITPTFFCGSLLC